MKAILFVVGSLISNTLFSKLIHNKAQPLMRNLVRRSVRFAALVFTTCLIGALTFASGLVMVFNNLAEQMTSASGVYFSPMVGFGIGLALVGMVFIYVGAFSSLLSPWRKLAHQDKQAYDESPVAQILETLIIALQNRPSTKEKRARRPYTSKHSTETLERDQLH